MIALNNNVHACKMKLGCIRFVHDPLSSLAYPTHTHTHSIAGNFKRLLGVYKQICIQYPLFFCACASSMPNFSLAPALDVLSTGTYPRLPTSIKERLIPPLPLTDSEKASAYSLIDMAIRRRLVSEVVPPNMTVRSIGESASPPLPLLSSYLPFSDFPTPLHHTHTHTHTHTHSHTLTHTHTHTHTHSLPLSLSHTHTQHTHTLTAKGVVTFVVSYEFEVKLSVVSDDLSTPWRLISHKILVGEGLPGTPSL